MELGAVSIVGLVLLCRCIRGGGDLGVDSGGL